MLLTTPLGEQTVSETSRTAVAEEPDCLCKAIPGELSGLDGGPRPWPAMPPAPESAPPVVTGSALGRSSHPTRGCPSPQAANATSRTRGQELGHPPQVGEQRPRQARDIINDFPSACYGGARIAVDSRPSLSVWVASIHIGFERSACPMQARCYMIRRPPTLRIRPPPERGEGAPGILKRSSERPAESRPLQLEQRSPSPGLEPVQRYAPVRSSDSRRVSWGAKPK